MFRKCQSKSAKLLRNITKIIEAVNNAADNLETFSQQPDFLERVQFTFGEEIQLENVTEAVANIISGQEFPRLEILTQSELGSANAAYGIETNTIYQKTGFKTPSFSFAVDGFLEIYSKTN
ncbi:hypothetical protein [Spirulina sp. 06S082]|uniref:hypothetical protein n=1 Tax=Spirulina sp. 06S082 TaxID=3110248 RepID=UPI002B207A86|nr:hypothetical protein [Spirulina sp. 06S082]MEA5471162.1 hypothetical protein [Spirulina sp. 06S082]